MADTRPWGFREYVKSNGFHTVYLIKPTRGCPIKVGITEDPVQRLLGLQNAHFEELEFHRFWWLPGVQVAFRIESAFKSDFACKNVRGEWFHMNPADAVAYIEAAIARSGIWSLTQSQMEHLQDQWVRKQYGRPTQDDGPSPLRGYAPRTDEPWQRKPRKRGKPSMPVMPWKDGAG